MCAKRFDTLARYYNPFISLLRLKKDYPQLIKALNLKSDDIVADFGGGTGNFAKQIHPHVDRVYLIDESGEMLKHAGLYRRIIKVQKNFITDRLKLPPLDIAVTLDTLHHISSPGPFFQRVASFLKPGGRFMVYDFTPDTIKNRLLKHFESHLFLENITYLPPEIVETLLKQYRFKIESRLEMKHTYAIIARST